MERVKKGCLYFWIDYRDEFRIHADTDWRQECSTTRFEKGNYFLSTDEAEKVVAKLRAVLKGADVIEMPSEEEAEKESKHTAILGGYNCEKNEKEAYLDGFADCFHWIKSKRV